MILLFQTQNPHAVNVKLSVAQRLTVWNLEIVVEITKKLVVRDVHRSVGFLMKNI